MKIVHYLVDGTEESEVIGCKCSIVSKIRELVKNSEVKSINIELIE